MPSRESKQRIGRYEVVNTIARGGAGVVFRARDPDLNRDVALKLLLQGELANPYQRKRFERESELLARLRHRHVVSVHETGEHEGCQYLVLDLVEGESLQDRIDREGPLPPMQAARLIVKLAGAVQHTHDASLLHRDLKPSNVLLDEGGEPLLTDFGLARDTSGSHSKLSKTGQQLGTPGYWAPEQVRGKAEGFGPATDVYGLGGTLYACLTGMPPIDAETYLEMIAATEARAPEPPSNLNPDVPRALEAICLKCLEKDPARRYPSARALADDLERFLAGEDVLARVGRRLRVPHLRLVLGIVCAALLVGGGLGYWWQVLNPRRALALVEAGNAVVKQDVRAALKLYTQAVALDPDLAVAYERRGYARRSLRDEEGAIADADRALAIDPSLVAAWILRAETHLDPAQKLADYSRAIEVDPRAAPPRYARAFLLQRKGDLKGALADYDAALAVETTPSPQRYRQRADLQRKLNDLPAALADYQRAVAAGHPGHSIHRDCGQLLEALGRREEAVAAYGRAIEIEPRSINTLMDRAMARMRTRDLEGAIADFQRINQINPRVWLSWYRLGDLRYQIGQLRGAIDDLTKALGLRKGFEIYYRRGRARYKLGKHPGAIRDLNRCLRLKPGYVKALYYRGSAHQRVGHNVEARDDFRRLLELLPAGRETRMRTTARSRLAQVEAALRQAD